MKILLSTLAMLGLLTAVAVADDPTPAEAADSAANPCAPPAANPCAPPAANPCAPPAANPCAPPAANPCAPPDCASLEGDAQADCLAKNAAPPPEKTGKNMTKSNDNRMESYDSDE